MASPDATEAEVNVGDFKIRPLKEDECQQVIDMVIELAEFEKMGDSVNNTAEGLREDVFGQPQRCQCLVAEDSKNTEKGLVGYALYFYAYSTWERAFMHLEDLYVKPDYRGKGIGKKMYQACAQIALDLGCQRLQLEVLGWNKPAKEFYEHVGNEDNTETEGWHKMRMRRQQMEQFVLM